MTEITWDIFNAITAIERLIFWKAICAGARNPFPWFPVFPQD